MLCTIIGGGVQALATGILLEYQGHDTEMLAESFSYQDGADTSTVSTDYAAASIYPVQIESEYSEDELIARAEATFKPFYETDGVPVRKHTHYYLYEEQHGGANPARMEVEDVTEYDDDVPSRTGEAVQDGYVCKEYFVEMPEYVPLLYETYQHLGGDTEKRTVRPHEVSDLNGEVVFNCSGYGSRELFDDQSMKAIKGHILQVPYDGAEPLPFSYTYMPSNYGHYAYMYPRKETVLFGGSYLKGDIDDGEWHGESPTKPITIDDVTIPERLYTVTEDIMSEYIDISKDKVSAKYGYRPYRADGMRIEAVDGVVHNYGHGGSGVSMSWWSALQAIQHVANISEDVLSGVASEMASLNARQDKRPTGDNNIQSHGH
jgi:D-amino-acid oxidase